MADAGTLFRTPPIVRGNLGEYNRATKVASSTTFFATGSNEGAGFLVQNKSNVTIECSNGGTIAGTGLNTGEVYPIGVKKVTIAATGVVYVLHKS